HRGDEADDRRERPRDAEGEDRDREAVCADRHEPGDTHVEQAGEAEVHREPDGGEHVAERRRREDLRGGEGQDLQEIHRRYPILSLRPRMPCGRNSSTTMSTTSAPTYLRSDEIHNVDSSTSSPTMIEPTSAPKAVPRPPRVMAA